MKKVSLAILASISALAGAAYAQSDAGVTMSTDPATAADIEQRAQELQSQQQASPPLPLHHHKGGHRRQPGDDSSDNGFDVQNPRKTDIGRQPGNDTDDNGFDVLKPTNP